MRGIRVSIKLPLLVVLAALLTAATGGLLAKSAIAVSRGVSGSRIP